MPWISWHWIYKLNVINIQMGKLNCGKQWTYNNFEKKKIYSDAK